MFLSFAGITTPDIECDVSSQLVKSESWLDFISRLGSILAKLTISSRKSARDGRGPIDRVQVNKNASMTTANAATGRIPRLQRIWLPSNFPATSPFFSDHCCTTRAEGWRTCFQ